MMTVQSRKASWREFIERLPPWLPKTLSLLASLLSSLLIEVLKLQTLKPLGVALAMLVVMLHPLLIL